MVRQWLVRDYQRTSSNVWGGIERVGSLGVGWLIVGWLVGWLVGWDPAGDLHHVEYVQSIRI